MASEIQNPGKISAVTGAKVKISLKKRLTISALAEKLKSIEKESGFEMAIWAVSQINYQKLLILVNPADELDAPALMPSKYMLLPFVSASELKAKGNLNDLPFGHSPLNQVSFNNLALFLSYCDGIAGNSVAMELDKNGNLTVSKTSENIPSHIELTQPLLKTLNSYINASSPMIDEDTLKDSKSHTVVEHESLSSIAQKYGIKSWRLLLELNKSALGEDWDILKPGTKLTLPDPKKNPLKDWLVENGWEEYLSDNGYQYPGKYLSLTLTDLEGKKIEKLDPPAKCEVYCKNETADLIYRLDLENGEIDLVVPDCEVGIGVMGIPLALGNLVGLTRKEYLESREKNKAPTTLLPTKPTTHRIAGGVPEPEVDFVIEKLSGPYFVKVGQDIQFKVEKIMNRETKESIKPEELSQEDAEFINWKIKGEELETSFKKHGIKFTQNIPLAWAGKKLQTYAYRLKPSETVKVDSIVVPYLSYDGYHLKWINEEGKDEKVWEATGALPSGTWMALPEALEQLQAQENKVNRIPMMPFKDVKEKKSDDDFNIVGHGSGFGNTGVDVGDKIDEVIKFLKSKMGKMGIGLRSEGAATELKASTSTGPAWLAFAEKELKSWQGKTEDEISKTINYHKEIGIKLDDMTGTTHAWCASFVNYCLNQAGFKKWNNSSRASAVSSDDNFTEIDEPIYGAIALEGTHHVGFIYGFDKNSKAKILLGGNQSDQIKFSNFIGKFRYFLPKTFNSAEAKIKVPSTTTSELNTKFDITPLIKSGNSTR